MSRYEKYTLPVGEEDQLRLQALNAICNPFTLTFLEQRTGSLEGHIVADIGCGTGILVIEWAKRVGNTGKVYAIDISQEQLTIAKAQADALGLTNIEYLCQSIDAIDPTTIQADLVYSRFVLEHLADPWTALQKMHAMVRPGGLLFCENITSYDTLFCDPPADAFARWREAVLLQPKLHDTDFFIGTKLYGFFQQLAINALGFEIRQPLIHHKAHKHDFLLALQSRVIQQKYVDKGFYKPDEINAIANDVLQFSQQDGILAFPQYLQIIGRRC